MHYTTTTSCEITSSCNTVLHDMKKHPMTFTITSSMHHRITLEHSTPTWHQSHINIMTAHHVTLQFGCSTTVTSQCIAWHSLGVTLHHKYDALPCLGAKTKQFPCICPGQSALKQGTQPKRSPSYSASDLFCSNTLICVLSEGLGTKQVTVCSWQYIGMSIAWEPSTGNCCCTWNLRPRPWY